MPLKSPFSSKMIEEDFADNSPLVNKFRKFHNQKTLDSIKHRLSKYVEQRPHNVETGFTQFGIAMGHQAPQMPKTDYDYCWNKAIECFGDNDDAKKFLGSMLMQAFANSNENWLFVQDPEKKQKINNNEVPTATKYFLDVTGKGYESNKFSMSGNFGNDGNSKKESFTIVNNNSSIQDLAKKFNRSLR